MSKCDYVLVGLGNPGLSSIIRHNVGFMFLDYINKKLSDDSWEKEDKFLSSKVKIGRWNVLLCKPSENYNCSGNGVKNILKKYDLVASSQLVVVHDDVDLKLCTTKIKFGGGSGGCNGIKSIDETLKTNEYSRIRIGVGRPQEGKVDASWVCGDFPSEDLEKMNQLYVDLEEKMTALSGYDVESLRSIIRR